jgi:hypothetical protein
MLSRDAFAKLLEMMPFLLTGELLVSPGDLAAFRSAVESAGGVRAFLFEQLPRYAHTLRSIFYETVDVGAASADVNRRLHMMKQTEHWDWAPAAITFLAEHRGQPERARKYFQALDRFVFACELSVVDSKLKEGRYVRAMRHAGDDKMLYGPRGALELTDGEYVKLIDRLHRDSRNLRVQRLLMLRLEAAMPGGHILSVNDDVTLEHILPRKGGPWWDDRFPDKKMRTDAAFLIGNLTLVTNEQNDRAANKPYAFKRGVFFDTPGAPIHAVTEDMRDIDEWTLEAIEKRQERLIRILCADWDLVPGTGSKAA